MYFKATSNPEKFVRYQEEELDILCITYENEELRNNMKTWSVDSMHEIIQNTIQSCTDQVEKWLD